MRSAALDEARAALALRPSHKDAAALAATLEKSLAQAASGVQRVGHEEPAGPEAAPEMPADFNADSYALFVNRVQPVLMNACAGCHANQKGGSFRLMRAYPDAVSNARPTQYNIASTLRQIDREHPSRSPLLVKAVTPHGESPTPPLTGPQAAAFRQLEQWAGVSLSREGGPVRTVAATRPAVPATPAAPAAPPEPLTLEVPPGATAPEPAKLPTAFAADAPPVEPKPEPADAADDPFDPEEFNRAVPPG